MTPIEHIKNFLDGLGQAFVLDQGSGYSIPRKGDFARDLRNLTGDSRRVARGINKQIKAYGKSTSPYTF